jgi:Mg2+ and Co2+ transporter CorA
MDKHAYRIIKNRIVEIKQRQFQISNYLHSNKDVITEFQEKNLNSILETLDEEREELEMVLKIKMPGVG